MSLLTRRKFLVASGATAAAAGLVGAPRYSFASPDDPNAGDTVVVLMLRGGADGQMLIGRQDDASYRQMRRNLAITNGIAIPQGGGSMNGFFLSPAADAISDLLPNTAFFPAAGVVEASIANAQDRRQLRSHQAAQRFVANGLGNNNNNAQGWLGRMSTLQGANKKAVINNGNGSFTRGTETVDVDNLEAVTENAYVGFNDEATAPTVITGMNNAPDSISSTGAAVVASNLSLADLDVSEIRGNYPRGLLGSAFAEAATVLRGNVPVSAIQIDSNGWDHHGNIVRQFTAGFGMVGDCLAQFAADTNNMEEITLMIVTDFGRTMRPNGGNGTDHGRGQCVVAMGGGITGGVYGGDPYPLSADVAGFRNAMPVLTDIRDIYTEVMVSRADIPNAASIFNNYNAPAPMGFA